MRFVETPVFTEEITGLLSDDDYGRLQLALVLRPAQGAVIRGSGGLRKIRWGVAGRGKRGGVRVIYYWEPGEGMCLMLYAYAKSAEGDLTAAQVKLLRQVVLEEFK
jgi:mRNA-degrading endonuclease RelE of RelBE toxin-antitoxin system